jgi:hypothetical protein
LKGRFVIPIPANYVVDKKDKPVGVLLNIRSYRKILEDLEELEAIWAYDAAKKSRDEKISYRQAIREIERSRR